MEKPVDSVREASTLKGAWLYCRDRTKVPELYRNKQDDESLLVGSNLIEQLNSRPTSRLSYIMNVVIRPGSHWLKNTSRPRAMLLQRGGEIVSLLDVFIWFGITSKGSSGLYI